MTSTGWAGVIIAALVLIAVGWWFTTQTPTTVVQNNGTATTTGASGGTGDTTGVGVGVTVGSTTAPMSVTVTRTATGFSPETVTIKKGGTVKWVNNGSSTMWVASNQHPTHTLYSGTAREDHCPDGSALAFDQCATGNTYSFTFNKVGSWQYHNHTAATQLGTVIVVE